MMYLRLMGVLTLCLVLKISSASAAEITAAQPQPTPQPTAQPLATGTVSSNQVVAEKTTVTSLAPVPVVTPVPSPVVEPMMAPHEVTLLATPVQPVAPSVAYNYDGRNAGYGATEVFAPREQHDGIPMMITPMLGGAFYGGGWKSYLNNTISLGVALDFPTTRYISLEVEGDYARYTRLYGMIGQGFDQWDLAGNVKFYFTRGFIRPWVGAGLMGLYYNGMMYPNAMFIPQTDSLIAAGQALVGAEISVSDGIAVGARGAWVVPLFNRPQTFDGRFSPLPRTEDASLINTSFYKLLGTVSIAL